MKIDPAHKPDKSAVSKRKRAGPVDGKGSFKDVLTGASRSGESELEMLFGDIDESGQMLRDSPGLDKFKEYRERVARFIKEYLEQAYDVHTSSEMTLSGRQRHMILVKKIDDRLDRMYQEFLKEILDTGEMMKGLEEIRGMLLDLYH